MLPAPGAALDWLFLDLNSYFASVEQQENPSLRGKPVAVVPVMTDFTCAIAASYEAKAFGIKTGTGIREAKQKCPSIALVEARHDVYVRYHHRVLEEVDRHVPVHNVASIDEMACRLTGKWREPANALALARQIKEGLRQNVGECIRCSIGLSTNRYLAKVATDLQKPDGLVVLHPDELPERLMASELRDFPGIGRNMETRLHRAGIYSFEQLWACPPQRLRAAWGSIEGERFWHALRGVEIASEETTRGSLGHSHVLSPEQRPPAVAERVTRRLLLKAATRLRRIEYVAGRLSVSLRLENGSRLEISRNFPAVSDSVTLQECFSEMWSELAAKVGQQRIKKSSVTLSALSPLASPTQLELFTGGPNAETMEKRARLSKVLDGLTQKFGRDAITVGIAPGEGTSFTGSKIAFNRVPEQADFDEDR
jgi:DNA polymerase-4